MIALLLAMQVAAGGVLTGVACTPTLTSPTTALTYDAGTSATVDLSGTAYSDNGVASVTWVNSLGGSGTATGTTSWSIGALALTVGTNLITVTCLGRDGAVNVRLLTVTRIASGGGLSCADAATRCIPSEYATPNLCGAVTNPGDVCWFAPGTYPGWTISRAGTSGNTVSWLANGAVTITSAITVSASYNRVIDFNITGATQCQTEGSCNIIINNNVDGFELWNNTLANFSNEAVGFIGNGTQNRSHNLFIGNTSTGRTTLSNLGFGFEYAHYAVTGGSHTVVQYSKMNEADKDFILFYGPFGRHTNNYAWGPSQMPGGGAHSDFIQTGVCCSLTTGTNFTTIEANFYTGNPPASDQHFSNMETNPDNSGNILSRRNVVSRGESGQGYFSGWTSAYFINDLYIDGNQSSPSCGVGCAGFFTTTGIGIAFNTMIVEFWGALSAATAFEGIGTHDYNMGWDRNLGAAMSYIGAFGSETHRLTTSDPLFTDYAGDDFTPSVSSPHKVNGGALTTVTVGGTSVTSITVGDAGFFRGFDATINQYGGNIAEGDIITVGSTTVRVVSISGNVMTLDTPVTASAGTSVYYGDSNTPPRGPYPYKATYTITNSLSYAGGVITATINDPSIVRRVEFYIDGLPVAADISAPYTFSTSGYTSGSSHSVKAIARPLYASKVLAYPATTSIVVP